MASFFGRIVGQRGPGATRLGSAASGITVSAQSWVGSVTVALDGNPQDPDVTLYHRDDSGGGGRTIYRGKVRELAGAALALVTPVEDEGGMG